MIMIVDYGVGNLRSVQKAFEKINCAAHITSDPNEIMQADGLVLPGVGAFGDAMVSLRRMGMLDAIKRYAKLKRPLLGICLGMQLLFSISEEHGHHIGLGIIPGHVVKMHGNFKIPQVGWNQLQFKVDHALFEGLTLGDYAYFVHSYYVQPIDSNAVVATVDYYGDIPAIVVQDHVYGMQFHPEKSSTAGIQLLHNFSKICERRVNPLC